MTTFPDVEVARLCQQPIEFDFAYETTGLPRDVSGLVGGFVAYENETPIFAEKVGTPTPGATGLKSRMRFVLGAADLPVPGSWAAELLLRDPAIGLEVIGRWAGRLVVTGVSA